MDIHASSIPTTTIRGPDALGTGGSIPTTTIRGPEVQIQEDELAVSIVPGSYLVTQLANMSTFSYHEHKTTNSDKH